MAWKIGICDDLAADRDYLSALVRAWAGSREVQVEVRCFTSAEEFLFRYGEEKLFSVLDRAAHKLERNERVLTFTQGGEMVRIPIHQIRYAEVFGNYVTIHAAEDVTVKMTLGELEWELDDRFYRVSRSVVVDLTRVRRVTRQELRLSDGTVLPLSRGAYDGVNRAIIDMR